MPRCPACDYADRCIAVDLEQKGLSRQEIAQAVQRPERWVRRTLARYNPALGLHSLADEPSRPRCSPQHTPAPLEQAICDLKKRLPPM
jgi:hypothetical protein